MRNEKSRVWVGHGAWGIDPEKLTNALFGLFGLFGRSPRIASPRKSEYVQKSSWLETSVVLDSASHLLKHHHKC